MLFADGIVPMHYETMWDHPGQVAAFGVLLLALSVATWLVIRRFWGGGGKK